MLNNSKKLNWIDCEKMKPPGFSTVNIKVEGKSKPLKAWWSESQKCWIRKLNSPTGRLWGSDLKITEGVTHWRPLKKPAFALDYE